MPQTPDWAKYLSAGVEFVAITQTQARSRAKELVSQGQLAQSQVQGFVDDLVDESRRRSDSIVELVRHEIGRQVKTLGIATKEDLTRLEAKLARSTAVGASSPRPARATAAKNPSAKKTPAKQTVAKQTIGKKSAVKSTGAKKTAVKRTAAKKMTAKQTAPAPRAS